ncbi:MAG: uroporphyrinogen decarboxylase family protein [Clostridia bacterium]
MSYQTGLSAMNLEMPKRIPRTEYSAELFYDLMKAVTGLEVNWQSSSEEKLKASQSFRKAWNYDFNWNIMVNAEYAFKSIRTRMGHAEFAQDGGDYTRELSTLFSDAEDVLAFDPFQVFPPVDMERETVAYEKNHLHMKDLYPDEVNMTGIYITCISGLIDLFGWDMLLYSAGVDPKRFGEMTRRYSAWIRQYFVALAKSDVPVVMIHDDMVWTEGPFIHPDWYRKYVFPDLKKNLEPLRQAGKKIIFTCDGNYNQFIDDIAACGVDGFVLEPITDMGYIAEKYGKTHVIIGNADTRIMMFGSREDITCEVKRCIDTGKNCPGFFMAIGNHISSNCPVENMLYYNEVYEKLGRR